jgi:hypothetical protein
MRKGFTSWELARLRASSSIGGFRQRDLFADLEAFCVFIGYPRSGHSLVGSLLDAHPQMIVAHELDALRFVEAGFTKLQLFHLLLANSERSAALGREQSGYSYAVPGQWQGKSETLRVIGDKKGGVSTRRLQADPGLLQRLAETVDLPLKVIHVTRNPYDNIAAMAMQPELRPPEELRGKVAVSEAMQRYFALCETIDAVSAQLRPEQIFHLRHETLVEAPAESLGELCVFLGTGPSAEYLRDCAAIVRPNHHRSRADVSWSRELISAVAEKINRYPFLKGYSFES